MVEGRSECIPETLESLKASFLFFAVVFFVCFLFCFVSFYIPTTAFLLPLLPPTLTPFSQWARASFCFDPSRDLGRALELFSRLYPGSDLESLHSRGPPGKQTNRRGDALPISGKTIPGLLLLPLVTCSTQFSKLQHGS